MDKFAEAFPLSDESNAIFLATEDFEKLSGEEQKAKEEEALKSVVGALDKMVEWKSHFPDEITQAVSILARAVGYGVAPSEEEGDEKEEETGSTEKAIETILGKFKGLVTAISTATSKLEEELASKMLRAAKGELVQFDDLSIELELEEGEKTVISASKFIALLEIAIPEVIQEGVEDAA